MTAVELKNRIMLRVYMIYAFRKLRQPILAEAFLLAISFALLSILVSLPHIISNIILTQGSPAFFLDAFTKAQVFVKLIVLTGIITTTIFVWNVSRRTTNLIRTRLS